MPSEKEIRAAFAVFDADKSGALSVDELRTVLTRPGTGVTPLSVEEIQALIDEFDADGDGEMQYEEFAMMWGGTGPDGSEDGNQQPRLDVSFSAGDNSRGRRASFKKEAMSFSKKASTLKRSMSRAVLGRPTLRSASVLGAQFQSSSDEFAKLQTAAQLRRLAAVEQSKAAEVRAKAPVDSKAFASEQPFEARLGLAMVNNKHALAALKASGQQKLQWQDLLRMWDRNDDGVLNKIEFRQAVRSEELGIVAKNSEIDAMFKEFDSDGDNTLTVKELKPCLMALQDAAIAAKASREAEERRANICDEKAIMLLAAANTMDHIWSEEQKSSAVELKYSLPVRIGIAIRKSKRKLDQLIKAWPDGSVGYATRDALEKGLRQLNVRIDVDELDAWFQTCYEAGVAKSICRPAAEGLPAAMSLKVDLPPTIAMAKREHELANQRDAAIKELKRGALAEQDAIRVHIRKVAKQWADNGKEALKAVAEMAAAKELAERAKREAAMQRKAEERRKKEQLRKESEQAAEGVATATQAKVYNVQLKSPDVGRVGKRRQSKEQDMEARALV